MNRQEVHQILNDYFAQPETHSDECWKYHGFCMAQRLLATIEQQQSALTGIPLWSIQELNDEL